MLLTDEAVLLVHRGCGTFRRGEEDAMRKSGGSMIQVPRGIISGMMFALVPAFFLVLKVIDDPGLRGVRGVEILRLVTIGFGAGIFFSGLMLLIRSKVADRTSAASGLD